MIFVVSQFILNLIFCFFIVCLFTDDKSGEGSNDNSASSNKPPGELDGVNSNSPSASNMPNQMMPPANMVPGVMGGPPGMMPGMMPMNVCFQIKVQF